MDQTEEKLYYNWLAADNSWQAELERNYGNKAGDARYDLRGTATARLRELKAKFVSASKALSTYRDIQRSQRDINR
jgi:hypothetical protein